MTQIRVTGLLEFKRAIALVSKEAPKELAKANKRIGQIVVAEARARAPKGPHEGGGKVVSIARSLHASLSPNRVSVIAGGKHTPHAAGAEFGGLIPRRGFKGAGHRARRIALFFGGRSVTHLRRHAYLFPAVEAKLPQIWRVYEQMLDDLKVKFLSA